MQAYQLRSMRCNHLSIALIATVTFYFTESIGGPQWQYFSAVCWLYGRFLYEQLDIPIGLIAPVWGGTPIEPWSSQAALKKCGILTK